jgi:hypothetical protein
LHAGHRLGGGSVDRDDPGVRISRAHEARVQLAGRRQVVGELADALEQAFVLDALDGVAAAEARGDVGGKRAGVHGHASSLADFGAACSGRAPQESSSRP